MELEFKLNHHFHSQAHQLFINYEQEPEQIQSLWHYKRKTNVFANLFTQVDPADEVPARCQKSLA